MNLAGNTVRLSSGRGTVVFGTGGFLLHRLQFGAPTIENRRAVRRRLTLAGYILPTGDTAAERVLSLSSLSRRLLRICTDPDGFFLTVGEQQACFRCAAVPVFSDDPAFATGDASFFTVEAESVGEAYFSGREVRASMQGRTGALIFPMVVTESTRFGTLTAAGATTVRNAGDASGGFFLTATAGPDGLTFFRLSSEAGQITVSCPMAAGETLTIDTRTGQKGVRLGGASAMAYVDWQSEFFSLAPGDNQLVWESDGPTTVHIAFTPLYL